MPKKKIIYQTHGKVENPITLDQIWGDTGITKYGTLNLEEYEKKINDFNKSDLQTHATQVGLIPVDNREILLARLLSEFKKHVAHYNVSKLANQSNPNTISKSARDILAEGR